MRVGFYDGAMYVQAEDVEIDISPIKLGNKYITPGSYINKLGDKKRTSFEMQDGWYLRYVGKLERYLLFGVNSKSQRNMYYAFIYVDSETLLIQNNVGFRDVKIKELEVFHAVELKELDEQLSLFNF